MHKYWLLLRNIIFWGELDIYQTLLILAFISVGSFPIVASQISGNYSWTDMSSREELRPSAVLRHDNLAMDQEPTTKALPE